MSKILHLWARISRAGGLLQEEASLGYIMKPSIKKKNKTGRNQVIESFSVHWKPFVWLMRKANFGIVGSWRDFGVETRVWATVVFSVGKKCSSFSSQCVYASFFLVLQPGPNVSWCEGVLMTQSLFSVMMSLTLPSRTTNEALLIFLSFLM